MILIFISKFINISISILGYRLRQNLFGANSKQSSLNVNCVEFGLPTEVPYSLYPKTKQLQQQLDIYLLKTLWPTVVRIRNFGFLVSFTVGTH